MDVLYPDEDKVDEQECHSEPHFKPAVVSGATCSPATTSGHLVVVRTDLVA